MAWKVEQDDKNLKEYMQFPDMSFPFFACPDVYSLFMDQMVDAHWHFEFEYSYVASGRLDYYINENYISLQPGDSVFINSNMLHMAKLPADCDDAIVYTIIFHASVLTSDIRSTIYTKYVQPIINTKLEGFKICIDHPLGFKMATLLTEMLKICFPASLFTSETMTEGNKGYARDLLNNHIDKLVIDPDVVTQIKKNAKEGPTFNYELECLNRLIQLLETTLRYINEGESNLLLRTGNITSIERAREIIAYIYAHYQEKITVDDVSKHVGISRNECFRCFKRFTGKKPIEYLNDYRLLMAAQTLKESEKSIEDISAECGFASASFFGKMFKEKYKKTPLQFRKEK